MRKFVRFLAVMILVAAFSYLIFEFMGNRHNKAIYEDLMVEETVMVEEENGQSQDVKPVIVRRYRLEDLQKANPDCIGIVEVAGTDIYYPVLYSREEDGLYYINRNFNKERDGRGSIFMDYRCDYKKPSANLVLYGHRMRNNQMFAQLKQYKSKSFWQEHQIIFYTDERGTGTYRIFAAYMSTDPGAMNEDQLKYQMNFIDTNSQEEKERFAELVKSWSYYSTGLYTKGQEEFITLRTCDYAVSNGRISVVGYLEDFQPAEGNDGDATADTGFGRKKKASPSDGG